MDKTLTKPLSIDHIFMPLLDNVNNDLTKRHISNQIDLDLGFKVQEIEKSLTDKALAIAPDKFIDELGPTLHNGAQTWVGLDFQIVQCSYFDLKTMFEIIKPRPFQRIVDLGAGYGRIGIFLHQFHPLTHFLGIELVPERVNEGNRIYKNLQSLNKTLVIGDLSQYTELPSGDIYFIYDFGSLEHINKILALFKNTKNAILVVKGQFCRELMLADSFFGPGFKVKSLEDVFVYYL